MGIGPNWQPHEIEMLGLLIKDGLTNHEIAEIIDRPPNSIAIKAQRWFGGNPNYRTRITKHAHLRESAMKYFLTHSFEETAAHFGLTHSEFKSLATASYLDPDLRHLRKEKRTHDKWTSEELIYLLRHAGLQQRSWIAEKIQRGSCRVIKEKLMSLRMNTKTLNGMTLSRFRLVFGCEPPFTIEGNAGPTRGCMPTFFKIVPWVVVEGELKAQRIRAPGIFVQVTETMANFQRWIHGDDPVGSLRLAAGEGHEPPLIERSFVHQTGRTRKRKDAYNERRR